MKDRWTLAIHGGAGVKPGRDYSEVVAHMTQLVATGEARLAGGASALDTVEQAVADMEASGLYVAGRGSPPGLDGSVEMDAAIMDGALMRAGAVAVIRDVESPVAAARAVLERTPHVLLAGEGAIRFAHQAGVPPIGKRPDFFRLPVGVQQSEVDVGPDRLGHGTVGAVALDREGRLAAATSTGGIYGKRPGRVGDAPVLGAGTWADDILAASCTGIGEMFILSGGARDVSARMRYGGQPLVEACEAMLAEVARLGGDGGIIAMGADGIPAFAWNSAGLKRAAAGSHLQPMAAI
ncbi:isoaspartyl peptidase/L-asparaginase family protein [Sandaracinobacteroides hominis]|uniref:isoaspartyl peptidase/L-asparaginase family protein n=1 Tax=Sandaracinobacteroides hominis TaxID=2780086 RepID=UPI0018F28F90|nr:isoaspartyl peptidase/L-asparaginase [Sandaracinobacteroides hominis]